MSCEHFEFEADVNVGRLSSVEGGPITRYTLDLRVKCAQCGKPFRFIGLLGGCDLNGAATSADAQEARLAIAPAGEVVPPIEGPHGFSIRRG